MVLGCHGCSSMPNNKSWQSDSISVRLCSCHQLPVCPQQPSSRDASCLPWRAEASPERLWDPTNGIYLLIHHSHQAFDFPPVMEQARTMLWPSPPRAAGVLGAILLRCQKLIQPLPTSHPPLSLSARCLNNPLINLRRNQQCRNSRWGTEHEY